jgi:serine/threonine protein kinase
VKNLQRPSMRHSTNDLAHKAGDFHRYPTGLNANWSEPGHEMTAKAAALNSLNKDEIEKRRLSAQMNREIGVCQGISHPNIIRFHDVTTSAMEHCPDNLLNWVEQS